MTSSFIMTLDMLNFSKYSGKIYLLTISNLSNMIKLSKFNSVILSNKIRSIQETSL